MDGSMYGNYSRDGYSYWGYVETERRMMEFVSPEEYHEYISQMKINKKEPYWKQQGSYLFGEV